MRENLSEAREGEVFRPHLRMFWLQIEFVHLMFSGEVSPLMIYGFSFPLLETLRPALTGILGDLLL